MVHSLTNLSCIAHKLFIVWTSLAAQMVKNLPTMQETWVWSLGQEDPLEKGMATLSSILAWRILWTEEPGGLQSMGLQSWTPLSDWIETEKGSSVYGILQARILERVAISFSRGSSWPRKWMWVSCTAGRFFTIWATREAYPTGVCPHLNLIIFTDFLFK